MHGKRLKKRVFITLVLVIFIVMFFCYKIFWDREKKEIYCESLMAHIYDNEINLERFAELQEQSYWTTHMNYKKFEDFDFKSMGNLGNIFEVWYCIGFDKSLNGKIKEIASKVELPEEAKDNLMYYFTDGEQPFEGFRLEENGDGTYLVFMYGVTRNKNMEEIKDLFQNITIQLYIQYEDGNTETKPIKFKMNQINIDITSNNHDSLLIEKENQVEK